MKDKKRKRKKKLAPGIKWILIITNLLVVIFLGMTYFLNILPLKYFLIIFVFIGLFDYVSSILIIKRNHKKRIIGMILSLLLIIVSIIGIRFEFKTNDFLRAITHNNVVIESYYVLVQKDSNYSNINELKDHKIGVIDDEEYKEAKDRLYEKIKYEIVKYDDSVEVVEAMNENKIDAFLIEESQKAIMEENYEGFSTSYRDIFRINIEKKQEDNSKKVNITSNSFIMYISGIDTYGSINKKSRSDVNMIVAINPNTHKISLVDIPRDYYVKIYGKEGNNDKLTHAGIWGIDTSVKTIENLLGIEINYYVKFNFTSVVKIVDKIGGVRVYSDQEFTSGIYDEGVKGSYHYVKGYNDLDGNKALSFARERYSFADGDRVRGAHQQALIEAIIDKVTSPAIIMNYSSLLKALSETFVTSLDDESLRAFIKMQIEQNIKWEISKYVINGTNGFDYTYSYPKYQSYVMLPDEESLNEAKNLINTTLN